MWISNTDTHIHIIVDFLKKKLIKTISNITYIIRSNKCLLLF